MVEKDRSSKVAQKYHKRLRFTALVRSQDNDDSVLRDILNLFTDGQASVGHPFFALITVWVEEPLIELVKGALLVGDIEDDPELYVGWVTFFDLRVFKRKTPSEQIEYWYTFPLRVLRIRGTSSCIRLRFINYKHVSAVVITSEKTTSWHKCLDERVTGYKLLPWQPTRILAFSANHEP